MPIKDNNKVILSFSSFDVYTQCPHLYFMQKIKRVKTGMEDYSRTVPGTIVHESTEEYLKNFDESVFDKEYIDKKVDKYEFKQGYNLVSAYGSMDKAKDFTNNSAENMLRFLIARNLKGKDYLSEFWFGTWDKPLHLGGDLYTVGGGDLLEDNPNGTSILYDFKATWSDKNLSTDQLILYKIAYEKLIDKKITMCSFFLIPANRSYFYSFTKEQEQDLLNRMQEAAKNILAGNFPRTVGRKCAYCEYQLGCSVYRDSLKELNTHLKVDKKLNFSPASTVEL